MLKKFSDLAYILPDAFYMYNNNFVQYMYITSTTHLRMTCRTFHVVETKKLHLVAIRKHKKRYFSLICYFSYASFCFLCIHRWICCKRDSQQGQYAKFALACFDRIRVPWFGGAVKVNVGLISPVVLIPLLTGLSAFGYNFTVIVAIMLPISGCLLYRNVSFVIIVPFFEYLAAETNYIALEDYLIFHICLLISIICSTVVNNNS